MKISEAIKELINYDPDMPCAMILWQPTDIVGEAEHIDVILTPEEVEDILDSFNHESVTEDQWERIRYEIDHAVKNRKGGYK